jgi:hypothetical protein
VRRVPSGPENRPQSVAAAPNRVSAAAAAPPGRSVTVSLTNAADSACPNEAVACADEPAGR